MNKSGFTAVDGSKDCLSRGLIFLAFFAMIFECSATYASSFVIVPTYDSTITSDSNAATIEATINSTIGVYEATFTDPITVNITFQEMNSGLGQSSTFFDTILYSSYLTALTADKKSSNDAIALAHLGAGPNNPVNNNPNINVKLPNLRAVGIMESPLLGQPDGTIGLNTSIMNLSRAGQQNPSKYDLMAVVSHEINEVLGLGSALPNPPSRTIFPEDLFRYASNGARTFTTSGDNAYFSIDGTNDLARFNQDSGGDYGDWWSTGAHTPQVQDAFGTAGAQPNLGVEVTALDVIGYDVAPEPGTVILLGTGLVIAGLRRRRGRQAR
ncbi:MAG: hypothetical protein DMG31_15185 [Acidobacteria bacterium]|nr:MAG: hypothetical protein DMG31_15185 [Acidobacteriota bacterium]